MVELTPEKARIFRITHINNAAWILQNGLHCKSSNHQDPNFVQIGNPDLIAKRTHRTVPIAPGGTLHDYVPFYFTPFSPMLLNIKTGWNGIPQRPMHQIVILTSSLHNLISHNVPFVFTDRHAYLQFAEFSSDLTDLSRIDWKILQARDFKRNPNDPGKFERYQAEALVHKRVPVAALTGVVCHGAEQEAELMTLVQDAGIQLAIATRPNWFF
jgi:hypothetical protein